MADYVSYTTEAIILSRISRGEHDIAVTCLTHSLGIISAVSRSARKEVSRQRYGLTIGSRSTVTLVRGRQWRITSVVPVRTADFAAGVAPAWRHVMKTVETVLPRGVDDVRIFNAVAEITDTAHDVAPAHAGLFELWAQGHILHIAGLFDPVAGHVADMPFAEAQDRIAAELDVFGASVRRGLHALGILMQ